MNITLKKLDRSPILAKTLTRKELDTMLDSIDRVYYNTGEKPISDDSYDVVMDIYTERFPKSSRLKRVGAPVTNLKAEVPLPNPMSSLNKVKTGKALDKYLDSYSGPFAVSDKEDGMSLQLIYDKGKPTELYSRGNGIKGKDISFLIPFLKIPKSIPVKDYFCVRLEGTADNDSFEKHMHKSAGGKFTAVRNASGGILNVSAKGKSFEEAKRYAKYLTMFAFKIMVGTGSTLKPSAQFKKLKSMGFTVVPYKVYDELDLDTLSKALQSRKKNNKFNIDGLVIEQDKYHRISKANPKHAVSFKENSQADMVDVTCIGVSWNASRTGKSIPQVNIAPTQIGGVMVSNFTGHNAFYILHGYLKGSPEDKAKAKPRPIGKGAVLRAVRSGDVIPYIVEVLKGAKSASAPDTQFKMVGVHYITTGDEDKAIVKKKKITHFFTTLGVESFKYTTISKFYDNGYTTLSKFLNLRVEDFENIEGFGARKAQVFLTSLRSSLASMDFAKIANASGYFNGFSTEKFAAIYDQYPKVLSMDASKRSTYTKILSIHGFSDKTTSVFIKGLPKLQKLILKYGFKVNAPAKVKVTSKSLSKFKITFTGVRNPGLADAIASMGGKVQSMKADTNMLIIKDSSYSNKKVDKAIDAGIKVLTVSDFITKYKVNL